MSAKYDCHACKKQVTGTKNNRYRAHSGGDGEPCENSSGPIPEHLLAQPVGAGDAPDVPREGVDFATCPQCERRVKLTRLGYFEPHQTTLRGGERCPLGGVRAKHARKVSDLALPGDLPLPPSAAVPKVKAQEEIDRPPHEVNLARDPMATSRGALEGTPENSAAAVNSPESTSTSTPSTESAPSPSAEPSSEETSSDGPEGSRPFHLAPLLGDGSVLQPFSHISQPFPVPPRIRLAEAMSDRGKEIANRLRETFYAYTNRNHSSNRSAQKTLGPSEVGSPCDRQIAMKLLSIAPVNPQEGWAPFVGTAVHRELAEMFQWANGAGSGRYVTEMRVRFPSTLVPYGTLDLLDRVLFMVDDHKLMGRYSLDKLIQQGPSETYRVQLQIYGLGAVLAGEKVKEVALIAWPRQESSLDKLYVHVEPFDRKVAEEALARVERLAEEVRSRSGEARDNGFVSDQPMKVAATFPPGDDCKWCPFHLKADKGMERGCPGK